MDISDSLQYTKENFLKIKESKRKFLHKDFTDCSFENCNFLECEFYKCSFTNCRFINCDLSVIKVTNSQFSDVLFKNSKVIGVDWTKAGGTRSSMIISINFLASTINYSSFFGLKLHKMQLIDCIAHEVDFTEADLTESICRKTDFFDSKFQHANLTKADFTDARNYVINPNGAIIKKAKFSLPEAMSLLRAFDIVIE